MVAIFLFVRCAGQICEVMTMRMIDADSMKADLLTVDPRYEGMIKWCITVLDAQPTVERKTGKWEQDNPFTKPRCSECGEPCCGLHGFDYTLTPYCPNCGADMRETP